MQKPNTKIKSATYNEPVTMRVVHTRTWDKFKFNLMLTPDGKYHVDVLPLNSTAASSGIALNAYDEPFTDIDLAMKAMDDFIESGYKFYYQMGA